MKTEHAPVTQQTDLTLNEKRSAWRDKNSAIRHNHALTNKAFYITMLSIIVMIFSASCIAPLPTDSEQSDGGSVPAVVDEPTTEPATESVDDAEADATAEPAEETADASPTEVAAEEDADAATTSAAMEFPAPEGTYKGIPVGFTSEGFPYRGSPDAPITMYEYSDYQCPFCSRYFVQTEPALDESYVRSGEVRVVFRDFPLADLHPNAPAAHVASLCAADQGAEFYWQMHSQLFQTQSEWNQSSTPRDYFAGLAEEVGLNMDEYIECVDGGEKELLVAQGIAEARSLGFSGTPSFHFVSAELDDAFPLVGAQPYDQFAALIDALLAGEAPQSAESNSGDSGEVPYWATAEGLMPDPDNPGYTMAGDQYRGNPDASVVVVEFSDLQCPFCRRHTLETQPILDEQFVDTDQVFWVFKHFPLSIHPQAPAAGAAAECAAEQGMFWEMHELLFEEMQRWSIGSPNPIFVELAGEVGLDTDAFATCLDDEEIAARVQSDMADGASFVRGTPTFIVLYDGQGSIIPGALPAERFTEILQGVLDGTSE